MGLLRYERKELPLDSYFLSLSQSQNLSLLLLGLPDQVRSAPSRRLPICRWVSASPAAYLQKVEFLTCYGNPFKSGQFGDAIVFQSPCENAVSSMGALAVARRGIAADLDNRQCRSSGCLDQVQRYRALAHIYRAPQISTRAIARGDGSRFNNLHYPQRRDRTRKRSHLHQYVLIPTF